MTDTRWLRISSVLTFFFCFAHTVVIRGSEDYLAARSAHACKEGADMLERAISEYSRSGADAS